MSRLYELLARVQADGSFKLSARDVETINGRDFEGDPRPVLASDADVVAFISQFNSTAVADAQAKAATLAARDATIANLQAQLQTSAFNVTAGLSTITDLQGAATAATEAHAAQVAALQAAAADAAESHASQVAYLQAAHATEVASLQATIDALRNPPSQPRTLYPSEFQARFTTAELRGIFRAAGSDVDQLADVAMQAVSQMFTVQSVDLDNPLLTQLLDDLTMLGLLADGRKEELLVDRS